MKSFMSFILFSILTFKIFAVDFVIPEINTKFDSVDAAIDALELLTSGQIYVGNGSNVATGVAVSGDITLSNAGVAAIAAGVVTEADLEVATTDGLLPRRMIRATYDFSVDGGAIGTIASGINVPDNAIITKCFFDVITTLTSATDAATFAINLPTDGDLHAAIAISEGTNTFDAGLQDCDTKGNDDDSKAAYLKTTGSRDISWVIATEAVTAGKLVLFLEYMVSD